jgi:vesicle-associated membrane protein 72
MALIYAFVARAPATVLADYTTYSGNFATVAVTCLNNIPAGQSRFTYAADGHTFNFLLADGFSARPAPAAQAPARAARAGR